MKCIYYSFYSEDLQFTLEIYQFKKMYTEKTMQYNFLSKNEKEQWKITPTTNIQTDKKVRKRTGVSQAGERFTSHTL